MNKKIEEKTHEVKEEQKEVAPVQDIIVQDIEELRPVELPLVIKLPPDASKAQIEFAKVLNAYAYKNRVKWNLKKDDKVLPNGKVIKGLISQLRDLKNAPDPVENNNLTFKNKLLE